MAFGQLAYGADAMYDGSFTVNCLAGTLYTVNIGVGLNATNGQRNMKNTTAGATDVIPYDLYTGDRTADGVEITSSYANEFLYKENAQLTQLPPEQFVGSSNDQVFDLVAYISGADTTGKAVGSYEDTVQITVNY